MPTSYGSLPENNIVCLIVGNPDFIGYELARQLLGQNCTVAMLVDGYGALDRAGELLTNQNCIKLAASGTDKLKELFARGVDYVFYLKLVDMYYSRDLLQKDQLLKTTTLEPLLQLCHSSTSKILLASLDPAVEQAEQHLIAKAMRPTGTFWEVQERCETILTAFATELGIDARIVRIAQVYGLGMPTGPHSLISDLLSSAVRSQPVTISVPDTAEVFVTSVEDVAFGMIKAMFSQSSGGRMYALIDPEPVTLHKIFTQLNSLLSSPLTITPGTHSGPVVQSLPLAMIKSQESLGWFPRKKLSQTLPSLLEWFGKQPEMAAKITDTPSSLPVHAAPLTQYGHPQAKPKPKTSELRDNHWPVAGSTQTVRHHAASNPATVKGESLKTVKSPPLLTIQPPVVQSPFYKLQPLFQKSVKLKKAPPAIRTTMINLVLIVGLAVILPQTVCFWGDRVIQKRLSDNLSSMTGSAAYKDTSLPYETLRTLTGLVRPYTSLQRSVLGLGPDPETSVRQETDLVLDEVAQKLAGARTDTIKVFDVVMGRGMVDLTQAQQNIKRNLTAASEQVAYLEANLRRQHPDSSQLPSVQLLREHIYGWNQIITLLPDIISFKGRSVVAVVIQDNLELRPTGGLIDTIALLTFDKGKLIDTQFKSVYELDSQLGGQVKPPKYAELAVETYLNENQWWLRDSNMSADVSGESGARIAWFIHKELGIKVDGVWVVDPFLYQSLLARLGSLFVPELNETVTADNIFERLYSYSQRMHGELDTSRSFLHLVSQRMLEKVRSQPSEDYLTLLGPIGSAFSQRHLAMWYPSGQQQPLFEQWGWDGGLRKPSSQLVEFGTLNVSDYIFPVEANLGINKSNYYIERKLNYRLTAENDGKIAGRLEYQLKNNSQTENWPAGSYKTMVWFYLPRSTQVSKVLVRDEQSNEIEVDSKDLTFNNNGLYAQVGMYLEVPPGSTRNLIITSVLPWKFDSAGSNYGLYIQKQAGIQSLPVEISLNYPSGTKVVKLTDNAVIWPGQLEYKTNTETDLFFAVSFSR